jgi:hypothetical protein
VVRFSEVEGPVSTNTVCVYVNRVPEGLRRTFGGFAGLLVALILVAGCSSSTVPSINRSTNSKDAFPSAAGEFSLTSPTGVPTNGGCIPVSAITGPTLDWVFQVIPGHATTVVVDATSFHEPAQGCDTTDLDAVPRPLDMTGPHLTYAPGEAGTTTFSFEADRCKDGGHFGIAVWGLREESSEGPADRISTLTVVDCGFPSPPGVQ